MNDLKQFYRGLHTRCVAGQGSRSNQQPQKHINATTPKSFPTFVSVVLLCALSVMAHAQGFSFTNHGAAITITGYTGAGGDVVIPSSINGLQVTRIARYAFSSRTNLTSVMIPDSVSEIGRSAFAGCTGLTSVALGNGLMQMEGIFLNCTALTNVAIGHSVSSIPYWEFDNCPNLTAIVVDSLNFAYSSVDGVLFDKGQSRLLRYPGGKPGDYVIPEAVTRIEYLAFAGCSNLTSLVISDSVTVLGSGAFNDCTALANVTFGSNLAELGAGAFSGCTSLANFVLPDSVARVEDGAFQRCTSLTSVMIPHSITNLGGIGSWHHGLVFPGCTNLQAIVVDPLNPTYLSLDGVLFNKSQTEILEFPEGKSGGYVLPQSLIVVREGAFSGCAGLSSITMGNNVAYIGGSAFEGCSSLSAIVIPNSVTNIGYGAFLGCTALKSITIPDSVIEMGSFAFFNCTNLMDVTLGNGLNSIGWNSFSLCSALTDITIPNSVTRIEDDAFQGCTSLVSVFIPSSVTNIGAGSDWVILNAAFFGCASLIAINVDPLNSVFCSVDGVLLNKSQTELLHYPHGKTGSYTIPGNVRSIELNAFAGCTGLTSVSIGNNVTNIGPAAFAGSGLTDITIPSSVTRIADRAFAGCTNLSNVAIPNSITQIGTSAFAGCSGLTSLTVPDSVTDIREYAFAQCIGLTSVTIGNRVTNIEPYAFSSNDSTNPTAAYFRGNAPTVSLSAFPSQLTAYYLPGTTGWGTQLAGLPTAPWLPRLQQAGVQPTAETNAFGFTVTWASGKTLMVETCTNLTSPIWVRVQLSTLTNDSIRFHDQHWTNHPVRFYRVVAVDVPTDVIPVTNMVFIPSGTFTMGSPTTEAGRWDDEGPQTLVTISKGFWIGRYEVTQGEYLSLMATNPSYFNGIRNGTNYGIDLSRPVERVWWSNAVAYCEALTAREQGAGRLPAGYEYRLPTEAEWEYACRAGTTTPFYLGNAMRSGMANFDGRLEYPPCGDSLNSCTNASGVYLGRTVPGGSYAPNPWGLYDMIGNVSEWCQDWFGDYSGLPVVDPQGPASGNRRCSRGSSWIHPAHFLRSALRDYGGMEYRGNYTGFRVVLAPIP